MPRPLQKAGPDRLRDVYNYVDDFFGGGITPFEEVKRMQDANPVFINGFLDGDTVVGYYSLVPLKKPAKLAMIANQLFGAELTVEHMTAPNEPADGVYIGAIVANPGYSREVKGRMFGDIRALKPHPETEVLTRPITDKGRTMFEKLNFIPLTAPSRDGTRINHICTGTPEF